MERTALRRRWPSRAPRRSRPIVLAVVGSVLFGVFAAGAGAVDPAFLVSTLAAEGPHSFAATDLNGDRKTDLAVANYDSDSVAIRLGDGAGGFGAPSSVLVGAGPLGLAAGDLNRDGETDLAVANADSDNLSILLGDGDGGFSAGPTIPLTNGPWYVVVGDLNRDRRLDLVVTHVGFGETAVPSTDVSILLADGNGGFAHAPGSPITVGRVPYGVEIADFNRDRNPDLAIANQFDNFVSILVGDGTGRFQPAATSPIVVGAGPSWLVAADFGGDRNVDIAVAVSSGTIRILLGNGAGDFADAPGSPIAVPDTPHNLRAADFDGDGELDLGVDLLRTDSFAVFVGDGEGVFRQSGVPTPVGDGPLSMAVGDFNRDRRPDVVVGNHFADTVSVLLNATPKP